MTETNVSAGGGRTVEWRTAACPAELLLGTKHLTCQRPQVWQGPLPRPHTQHWWVGHVNQVPVKVNWAAEVTP